MASAYSAARAARQATGNRSVEQAPQPTEELRRARSPVDLRRGDSYYPSRDRDRAAPATDRERATSERRLPEARSRARIPGPSVVAVHADRSRDVDLNLAGRAPGTADSWRPTPRAGGSDSTTCGGYERQAPVPDPSAKAGKRDVKTESVSLHDKTTSLLLLVLIRTMK